MVAAEFPRSTRLRRHRPSGRSLAIAGLLAGAVLAGLSAGEERARAGGAAGSTTPHIGEALQASNSDQLSLTEYLRRRGALFYGAWWCPACFRQKHLFGKEAGNRLPYVECDKTDAGRERCKAADIRAYPTWVMGDRRLEGVQSLEELKRWSGYPGARPAP
jgi:hypothetical protein